MIGNTKGPTERLTVKNKNNNKKQLGSVYIAAVTIISIMIIAVLGFIVWQNFIQPKTSVDSNDSASIKSETTKSKTKTGDSALDDSTDSSVNEADSNYDSSTANFAIDYWNIKGTYSSSHKINYSISNDQILFIDSEELPASCTSGIARIKRFAADDYTNGYPASAKDESYIDKKASVEFAKNKYSSTGGNKKVGDYYYVLTTPMQYCVETGAESLQKTIFGDVLSYFKTLSVK